MIKLGTTSSRVTRQGGRTGGRPLRDTYEPQEPLGPRVTQDRGTGTRDWRPRVAGAGLGAGIAATLSLVVTHGGPHSSLDLVVVLVTCCVVGQILLELAVATVLVVRGLRRRGAPTVDLVDLVALETRAVEAEAALGRERERLHEVRATVGGLSLSHHLLHDSGDHITPEDHGRIARMHHSELERLQRLLAPTRGARTRAVIDLEEVLSPLVASVQLRGVRVSWDRRPTWAIVDTDAVSEMLHVLLENAVTHGAAREVTVSVRSDPGRVTVRVSDDGPGVPAHLADRLFERGVRGETSPGEGLGLYIARRLANESGGRLTHEPAPQAGAAFVLELPAHDTASSCPAHAC